MTRVSVDLLLFGRLVTVCKGFARSEFSSNMAQTGTGVWLRGLVEGHLDPERGSWGNKPMSASVMIEQTRTVQLVQWCRPEVGWVNRGVGIKLKMVWFRLVCVPRRSTTSHVR